LTVAEPFVDVASPVSASESSVWFEALIVVPPSLEGPPPPTAPITWPLFESPDCELASCSVSDSLSPLCTFRPPGPAN
jgi:hypothetical protein